MSRGERLERSNESKDIFGKETTEPLPQNLKPLLLHPATTTKKNDTSNIFIRYARWQQATPNITEKENAFTFRDGRRVENVWPGVHTDAAVRTIAPAIAAALRATVASALASSANGSRPSQNFNLSTHQHHHRWFVIVDAETFVVSENVRRALRNSLKRDYTPRVIYLGAISTARKAMCGDGWAFRHPVPAGWLLSREMMTSATQSQDREVRTNEFQTYLD